MGSWTGVLALGLLVAACSGADELLINPNGARRAAGGPASGVAGTTPGADAVVTGVPCDVQRILESRCASCHSGTSPARLLSYEDLAKPAPSQTNLTLAQASLERVTSATRPMPPLPAAKLTAAEIATLDTWVKSGAGRGEACAGTGASAGPAAKSPYDTPTVCTSNRTSRVEEGATMGPGRACIDCHSRDEGPRFGVAGTVYPTAHEPDDCEGVDHAVTVVVTDLAGTVLASLPVNRAGNFSTERRITPPFRVKLVSNGVERVMAGEVPNGDCNGCHTVQGTSGAPGRIMAP